MLVEDGCQRVHLNRIDRAVDVVLPRRLDAAGAIDADDLAAFVDERPAAHPVIHVRADVVNRHTHALVEVVAGDLAGLL